MLSIHPFASYRPAPGRESKVASPPYDVLTTEEARAIAEDNPSSFVRVIRPEVDFPDGHNPYDPSVYEKAAENLQTMLARGDLVHDEEPRLYAYQQQVDDHTQTGLIVCCSVDDYDEDRIKKHEKTRKEKEDDRTNHGLAVSAHVGPVFTTYRDVPGITERVAAVTNGDPLYELTADDGVRHAVWAVSDAQPLVEAFRDVPCAYVADGHHRAACASRIRAARRDANPSHMGDEEYNRFLAVLFPASQLRILAYNRLVSTLGEVSPQDFLSAAGEAFAVQPTDQPVPDRPGCICVYVGDQWYRLTLPPDAPQPENLASSLDVSVLQDRLLAPVLGVQDIRTDERISFVGGIKGPNFLEQRVRNGVAAAAFSLYPVPIEALMGIADEGGIMPPKSTWFEPKLRSGLVVHPF